MKLIIHGGAGARERGPGEKQASSQALREIAAAGYAVLKNTGARAAVIESIKRLEDNPLFNAGTGSRLQSDGIARMSAAIMDTDNYVLSGVINVEQVQNPIMVADQLGDATHTMLAGAHATAFARSQGIEEFDVVTRHRRQEWEDGLTGRTGTVGAVALDDNGVLCAATSTGGVGHETAGRVSDASTVAGTYACDAVGISCTGVGEEIVNQAVAVRIATRALDGADLESAATRTIREGDEHGYRYGLIALDSSGHHFTGQTVEITTLFAVIDETGTTTFTD